MKDVAAQNADARHVLLRIISSYRLNRHFSIHLVHKHFDLEEGRVMVYGTVRGPTHPDFILCSPRVPEKCENLHGLYFRARPDGTMAAYEYTTDPCEDLSEHTDFVAEFVAAVLRLGVQDIFALTGKEPKTKHYTEFEMSDLSSTILVNNPMWLPGPSERSTSTDWISSEGVDPQPADGNRKGPGIITLTDCTKTTSGGHYNFTCSETRNGTHYQKRMVVWDEGKGGQQEQLTLNGEIIPIDSELFAIISNARQMVKPF